MAAVSWAGAQTWLQTTGRGDTQGFDSSSAAFLFFIANFKHMWSCGLMDKAPPSGGGDCGFESHQGYVLFLMFSHILCKIEVVQAVRHFGRVVKASAC